MDKKRIVIISYASAFIIAVLTLLLPLYSVSVTTESQLAGKVDFYSFGSVTNGDEGVFAKNGFVATSDLPSSLQVPLFVLLSLTIITLLFLMVKMIALASKRGPKNHNMLDPMIMGAFFLSILTPIIFHFQWSSAIEGSMGNGQLSLLQDLLGSGSGSVFFSAEQGKNIGWFLELIVPVLIVLGMDATWNSQKEKQKAPEPVMTITSPRITLPSSTSSEPAKDSATPELHCGGCDKIIPLDARLCPYCGARVKL